jgi:hypothetical protein
VNGAIISDSMPTLTWDASPSADAAGYVLDWQGMLADVGGATQHAPGVLAEGDYTWTVAAYDAVRNAGSYTDTWWFGVDTTPPELAGRVPVHGAEGVAIDAAVVMTFSEAIEAGAFDYRISPDPGGWTALWNGSGVMVTLAHNPFAHGTTYAITVTAAGDLAGNPLVEAPESWSFSTARHVVYLPLIVRGSSHRP